MPNGGRGKGRFGAAAALIPLVSGAAAAAYYYIRVVRSAHLLVAGHGHNATCVIDQAAQALRTRTQSRRTTTAAAPATAEEEAAREEEPPVPAAAAACKKSTHDSSQSKMDAATALPVSGQKHQRNGHSQQQQQAKPQRCDQVHDNHNTTNAAEAAAAAQVTPASTRQLTTLTTTTATTTATATTTPSAVLSPHPTAREVLECESKAACNLRTKLGQRFFPTAWLASGHLQTIFQAYGAEFFNVPQRGTRYFREIIPVCAKDEHTHPGEIALDWSLASERQNTTAPPHKTDSTPIVLIMHGLAGGSAEPYVRSIAKQVNDRGFHVVVFNNRGCGGQVVRTPQLFCGAYTYDLKQVAYSLRMHRFRNAPLMAVGFSLGANILVKLLGEEGEHTVFSAAVALGNPWQLQQCSEYMHDTIYSSTLAGSLSRLAHRHAAAFKGDPRFEKSLYDRISGSETPFSTVLEFDETITRRVFNYPSAAAYYYDGSSARFVANVRCPLLCVNASDDPIACVASVPQQELKKNPDYVVVALTERGGHSMDWFEGILYPKSWASQLTSDWLAAAMDCVTHLEKLNSWVASSLAGKDAVQTNLAAVER